MKTEPKTAKHIGKRGPVPGFRVETKGAGVAIVQEFWPALDDDENEAFVLVHVDDVAGLIGMLQQAAKHAKRRAA